MPSVLFLDDDEQRHVVFRDRIRALGHAARYDMLYAYTAAEAIAALDRHAGDMVQAFLDHDLSVEDILIAVGAPSKVPTGMTVVDHIAKMAVPPPSVVVHSYNYNAAVEMCARLGPVAGVASRRIPFSELIMLLDEGQQVDAVKR